MIRQMFQKITLKANGLPADRPMRMAPMLMALVLGVVMALPMPASAQTFRFTSFSVEGNTRIEDATILAYAGIAPGSTVTGGQVNDALQRLQATGLFETVEITPRGATLVVEVVEFPAINIISIEGNRRLDDDQLLSIIQSQPRRVYSPATAEQDAAAIAEAYRASGRLTATVRPAIIRRDENRVDLVFEVTEGNVVETQRIAFVGNREYSDRRLRRVLESTQSGLFRVLIRSDTFIEDRIALDRQLLRDFYLDRGYADFQILSVTSELARGRDAYFVTFNLREGQSFDIGNVTVTSEIPEANADAFAETLRISNGVTYSPRVVDNAITRMETLATSLGLRFVRIEPVITRNDADLSLDIEFVISRGERVFVERIDIEGNVTTRDRVIRRQFDTVEGDPFDPSAIRQASERIRATGFFADVQVEGREGSAPDQIVIDVDVEEQPTGSLGFSASYSTDSGAGISVNFAEQNFLGRGQAVALSLNTVEGGQSFNFSFLEPNFMARDLAFGISGSYDITESQNRTFDTEDIAAGVSLAFPVSELGRMRVSYDIEQNSITGVPDTTSRIVGLDEGTSRASVLGLAYTYDSRDRGLNPNAGVRLQLSGAYAGLGGDVEFLRTRALAIAETAVLREEATLRASFEGGALMALGDDPTRLTDRFFLSSRQMRGYETFGLGPRDLDADNQDALGGNYYAVARFEAAFPLGLPEEYGISGGLFYDIGSVWGLDDTAGGNNDESTNGTVDDSMHLRSAIGVSVFWDTALGPLRFNFSRALTTESYDRTREFDFTVETRF